MSVKVFGRSVVGQIGYHPQFSVFRPPSQNRWILFQAAEPIYSDETPAYNWQSLFLAVRGEKSKRQPADWRVENEQRSSGGHSWHSRFAPGGTDYFHSRRAVQSGEGRHNARTRYRSGV